MRCVCGVFFFQAEDGIRDGHVTGVQTCALPISNQLPPESAAGSWFASPAAEPMRRLATIRRLPQRVLVIFYLGQPGTFETNRPHFFNLLATLRDGRCAA